MEQDSHSEVVAFILTFFPLIFVGYLLKIETDLSSGDSAEGKANELSASGAFRSVKREIAKKLQSECMRRYQPGD